MAIQLNSVKYGIRGETTLDALWRVQVNKVTGPGDIPAWIIIRKHAVTLAEPLTAIFNNTCILDDGVDM